MAYKNPEDTKAYARAYYEKNKARIDQQKAEYKARNLEKVRATCRESSKKWKAKNRERHLAYNAAWYAANKEAQAAFMKQWRIDNPEADAKRCAAICLQFDLKHKKKMKDLPQDLLEAKTKQLLLRRVLKSKGVLK